MAPANENRDNPPTPPSKWLTEVSNLAFFLCYDNARMKYNKSCKKLGAFEKLPSEEQGNLCAQAMDDLISKGYAQTYSNRLLEMASDHHRKFYDIHNQRHLWSYDAD